jgi:hypothetical protein
LHPAIVHGGYFLGSVAETPANRRFFAALERELPRWTFVAPIPIVRGGPAVLLADNGPLGIATRWVAELTVLAARLGQKPGARDVAHSAAGLRSAASPARPDDAPPGVMLTDDDQLAIAKLRSAAAETGLELLSFVEELLAARASQPRVDPAASALVGEVKGLFERLATDIPTHLARGMEAAFRDLVPRLGRAETALSARDAIPAASGVEIVQKQSAPREVATYASRRQKARRVKL